MKCMNQIRYLYFDRMQRQDRKQAFSQVKLDQIKASYATDYFFFARVYS